MSNEEKFIYEVEGLMKDGYKHGIFTQDIVANANIQHPNKLEACIYLRDMYLNEATINQICAKPKTEQRFIDYVIQKINTNLALFPSKYTPKLPSTEQEKEPTPQPTPSIDIDLDEHKTMLKKMSYAKIPIVINAFGGAGAGKSVACLDLCSELKKLGYVAEYVQEYAKDLVFDKNYDMLNGSSENQQKILKEQLSRMDRYVGSVDFIVTDSPILLNPVYLKQPSASYSQMVKNLFNQYRNFSFFVARDNNKENYETEGRLQTFEESIAKDNEIKTMLKNNNIFFGIYKHSTLTNVIPNVLKYKERIETPINTIKNKVTTPPVKIYTEEEAEQMTKKLKSMISIVDVAQSLGYTPVKRGTYYSLKEHDSCMLDIRSNKNCFYRNSDTSKDARGSIIDFCLYFGNMRIEDAYKHLYDMVGGQENVYNAVYGISSTPYVPKVPMINTTPSKEKQALSLPPKDKSQKNIFAYLQKTRCISPKIIKEFYDNKMLYQDERKNCVFVSYDEAGEPVFACKRGTNSYIRYLGDCKGCDYEKGFYINHHAKNLFICESVIDAMSYMTLLEKKGIDYHSYNYLPLTGVDKLESLDYIKKISPQINKIIIGLDNDKAGNKATPIIRNYYSDSHIPCITEKPLEGKDWNEYLTTITQKDNQQNNILPKIKQPTKQAEQEHEITP